MEAALPPMAARQATHLYSMPAAPEPPESSCLLVPQVSAQEAGMASHALWRKALASLLRTHRPEVLMTASKPMGPQ